MAISLSFLCDCIFNPFFRFPRRGLCVGCPF